MTTSPRSRRNEQAVAEMADSVMRDTRFDWMRTRAARRSIVALMIAMLVAMPVAWMTLPSLAALGVVGLAAIVWWALRMSVRVVADLPEEFLDERQARVRDRAYVEAYRWFAGLTLIAATAALIWFVVASENDVVSVELTWGVAMATFWAFEGLALTLPSIVLALREGDDPERHQVGQEDPRERNRHEHRDHDAHDDEPRPSRAHPVPLRVAHDGVGHVGDRLLVALARGELLLGHADSSTAVSVVERSVNGVSENSCSTGTPTSWAMRSARASDGAYSPRSR